MCWSWRSWIQALCETGRLAKQRWTSAPGRQGGLRDGPGAHSGSKAVRQHSWTSNTALRRLRVQQMRQRPHGSPKPVGPVSVAGAALGRLRIPHSPRAPAQAATLGIRRQLIQADRQHHEWVGARQQHEEESPPADRRLPRPAGSRLRRQIRFLPSARRHPVYRMFGEDRTCWPAPRQQERTRALGR